MPLDLPPGTRRSTCPLRARQLVRAFRDGKRHKARLFEDAGYEVRVPDGDPGPRMSASDIRARISQGIGLA